MLTRNRNWKNEMNEYILLYLDGDDTGWEGAEQGEAQTVIHFLEKLDEEKLSEHNWIVMKVEQAFSKDEFVHDGTIDHILEG